MISDLRLKEEEIAKPNKHFFINNFFLLIVVVNQYRAAARSNIHLSQGKNRKSPFRSIGKTFPEGSAETADPSTARRLRC